ETSRHLRNAEHVLRTAAWIAGLTLSRPVATAAGRGGFKKKCDETTTDPPTPAGAGRAFLVRRWGLWSCAVAGRIRIRRCLWCGVRSDNYGPCQTSYRALRLLPPPRPRLGRLRPAAAPLISSSPRAGGGRDAHVSFRGWLCENVASSE